MNERKYKLLFIEDDLLGEPYLVTPFERVGFLVDVAVNQLDAYNLLVANKYDAIILDNMLPTGKEKDFEPSEEDSCGGLKLLQEIEKMKHKPPIWVVTAFLDVEIKAKEERCGLVVEYIGKPFLLKRLAQKIKDYLGQSRKK